MGKFDAFLHDLFDEWRIEADHPSDALNSLDLVTAKALLSHAFADNALDVAGPPIPFDSASALAAAIWFYRVCWFLADRSRPDDEMRKELGGNRTPKTASDHLSADVVFRFLPQIYRRAIAIDPGDPLAEVIADTLRTWPLSGILAGLDQGPETLGDLGGHPGLWLLYAERYARRPRSAWLPKDGPIRDRIEWTQTVQGKAVVGAN